MKPRTKRAQVTEVAKTDAVLMQVLSLPLEETREQRHQTPHFVAGPVPVLRREGEKREILHAVITEALYHPANVFGTRPMAE